MDGKEKQRFFRSSWLTSSLVFGIVLCGFLFGDGVIDQARLVVAGTVFAVVSTLLFIYCRSLVR